MAAATPSGPDGPDLGLDPVVTRGLLNAWKILHVLDVSLAEAGRFGAVGGDAALAAALRSVLDLDALRGLLLAADELRMALALLGPDVDSGLDALAETLTSWEGPNAPNRTPTIDAISAAPEPG